MELDKALIDHGYKVLDVYNTFAGKYTREEIKKRKTTIKVYQSILEKLKRIPKIVQKSQEWYDVRNTMISASDFAQALGHGKFGTQEQLIKKKVNPQDESANFKNNPFFRWGNMFESVAISIYSHMFNVEVFEFGLIKHPTIPYFGSSPDGISNQGIMLEIKCPFKRNIDSGEVPEQYYYQMQGQLDVCGLEECDYFECKFAMVKDVLEWKKSQSIKGAISTYNDINEYSEVCYENKNPEKIIEWAKSKPNVQYWVFVKFNLKRITRDTTFLKNAYKELKTVWDKICFYKNNKEVFDKDMGMEISIDTEPLITTFNDICMIDD